MIICNYMGKEYPFDELKQSVTFNGVTYFPKFVIIKNGRTIVKHSNEGKQIVFSYNEAKAYNELVKGELLFHGLAL